jgi:hypothetical protein
LISLHTTIALIQPTCSFNPKIASLASRLVEPNRHDVEDEDEEALFAELEEEIENDSNATMREQALEVLKRE